MFKNIFIFRSIGCPDLATWVDAFNNPVRRDNRNNFVCV